MEVRNVSITHKGENIDIRIIRYQNKTPYKKIIVALKDLVTDAQIKKMIIRDMPKLKPFILFDEMVNCFTIAPRWDNIGDRCICGHKINNVFDICNKDDYSVHPVGSVCALAWDYKEMTDKKKHTIMKQTFKAWNKIITTKKKNNPPFGFGKYIHKTIDHVLKTDYRYILWALKNVDNMKPKFREILEIRYNEYMANGRRLIK
jgi:hypothetical protein